MYFDADQAVTGLMAKHLAEGRAFAVFQYAHSYVLVVEAWLTAVLFLIADTSVVLTKIVPVALNAVTAALLYAILTSPRGLRPAAALVAIAPFAVPGQVAMTLLTDALGMAIEPLMFALLIWMFRDKPLALGVTAGIAVKNREFALYAIAALVAVEFLRDRSRERWRGHMVAAATCLVTWAAVDILRQFSSPNGPGTSFAMTATGGDNLGVAASAACIDFGLMPRDIWVTVSQLLPVEFGLVPGATVHPTALSAAWLWIPLIATMAFSILLGLRRAWRHGPSAMTWFGLYLVIIGLAAVFAYATTRCGHASVFTLRYLLLAMLAPTGALTLGLERERRVGVRLLIGGVVALWTGISAVNTAALIRRFAQSPPERNYSQLVAYLEREQIRYIEADYWTGYYVAFVTDERIVPMTNFDRIHTYVQAVGAHRDRAAVIGLRSAPPCADGVEVAGFVVCAPPAPAQ